jgi:hypothetical protein
VKDASIPGYQSTPKSLKHAQLVGLAIGNINGKEKESIRNQNSIREHNLYIQTISLNVTIYKAITHGEICQTTQKMS